MSQKVGPEKPASNNAAEETMSPDPHIHCACRGPSLAPGGHCSSAGFSGPKLIAPGAQTGRGDSFE